ncbi:MAG: DNA-binding protein [Nitrososphaerales archaeon]
MRITEIRSGMSRISVEATVVSVSEPRTVNTRDGREVKVADAVIEDDSGQIKLTLWEDHIAMIKAGAKIAIENGYSKSFRGENSLNIGKYGKLEVKES